MFDPPGVHLIERFFRERGKPGPPADSGFLPDPETVIGRATVPELVRQAELPACDCLVLLGEPGMGKSTVMAQRRAELSSPSLFYDLRYEPSDNVLRDLANLRSGNNDLHILIDGVDEATQPNFPRLLVGALQKKPPDVRLRLELSCRASDWPPVLEQELPRIFPDSLRLFYLERLRRRDIADIALELGIDAEVFLSAVAEKDLAPLASVPILLKMLLRLFSGQRALPSTTAGLYEAACLQLCNEGSPTRQGAPSSLDPTQRRDVAQMLAAVTVLGRLGVISVELPPLVAAHELSTVRVTENSAFHLSSDSILQALGTGLFTTRSPRKWAWHHQTFAEFLAARWIKHAALSNEQIGQILFHHEEQNHLVPQLAGVARWLSCWNLETLSRLAQHAPEEFLQANSPIASDEQRTVAVEALLQGAQNLRLVNRWWTKDELRRLSHSGLAEQLRPLIVGAEWNPRARRLAIRLAAANRIALLVNDLCRVAEDPLVPTKVRCGAAEAAIECAVDPIAISTRLLPLVDDKSDDNDEFRAAMLGFLWPNHIAAPEFFRLLTPPRRPNHFGSYKEFLYSVAPSLGVNDLPEALKWVKRTIKPPGRSDCVACEDLAAAICRLAWENIETETVCDALATATQALLNAYKPVLQGPTGTDDGVALRLHVQNDRRRALIAAIARATSDPDHDAYNLTHPYGSPPFVLEGDIPWLIDAWRSARDDARAFYALLIRGMWWRLESLETRDLIVQVAGDAPDSPLLPFPRFVELGSREAAEARQWLKKERRWAERRAKTEEHRRRRDESAVPTFLDRAASGDDDAWWLMVAQRWEQSDHPKPLELLALCKLEDPAERSRWPFVPLAQQFLENMDAEAYRWIHDPSVIWRPALAGYLTLLFVRANSREWYEARLPDLAGRWAAAAICFSPYYFETDAARDVHREVIGEMFRNAPHQAAAVVRALLRREGARRRSTLAFLDYLPPSDEVVRVLWAALNSKAIQMSAWEALWIKLLQFDRSAAMKHARKILLPPTLGSHSVRLRGRRVVPANDSGRLISRRRSSALSGRPLMVLHALAADGRPDAWELAWRACQNYPSSAVSVLRDVANDAWGRDWGTTLGELALAQLYAWMNRRFPDPSTGHEFDQTSSFKNRLLSQLASRGTRSSVDLLRNLVDASPNNPNVLAAYSDAHNLLREETWRPLDADALPKLAASRDVRVVQGDRHLLTATLQALKDYEGDLHAETPAVIDLWNYDGNDAGRVYWPKEENDLSDHLKRFLQKALGDVIVNREVQIRPAEGSRRGQETDLLVQAVDATGALATVVVEVKGAWNRDLEEDLQGQLVSRYLSHGKFQCGIYVVFWCECERWDPRDDRCKRTRRRDRMKVQERLQQQAEESSVGERVVKSVILDATVEGPEGRLA